MATSEYQRRVDLFYRYSGEAREVLANPRLETPDHPYLGDFDSMIEHAALGIVDRNNGLIHTGDTLYEGGVVIVPLLDEDLESGPLEDRFSFGNVLMHEHDSIAGFSIDHLGRTAAECNFDPRLIIPVIMLSPFLVRRAPFQAASAIIHELDHAYRFMHRDQYYGNLGFFTRRVMSKLEVSAYALDKILTLMHAREEYEKEYEYIHDSQRDRDLTTGKAFSSGSKDPALKSLRENCFIHFVMERLGLRVDGPVRAEAIRALAHQQIIY